MKEQLKLNLLPEIQEVELKFVFTLKTLQLIQSGACVGMRGSRVQTIVNELHGEKIDIIKWTEDLPTLISESYLQLKFKEVLIDQDNKRIDIILTEENLVKQLEEEGKMLD